jgi:thiamine transporter
MKSKSTTRKLVESGVLLALGFVLSMLKVKLIPGGGSVTLVSMLPIVLLAYKYGPSWGLLVGLIHGLLQIVEGGLDAPPVQDAISYILVFLLDYALAWAVVGLLAGLLRKVGKPQVSLALGAVVGIAGRFLCSFTSGVIIWGVYAPEGQSAVIYSLASNATYLVPEMVFTALVGVALISVPALQRQLTKTK